MIPYIVSERNNNTIDCNADFVAAHDNSLIAMSLLDVSTKVKKVFSDVVLNGSRLTLCCRENSLINKDLHTFLHQDKAYKYRLTKYDSRLTHGIIFRHENDKYLYDWDGKGVVKTYTNFLRNVHYLPITEGIVKKVFEYVEKDTFLEQENLIEKCDIYTNNKQMKNIGIYYAKGIQLFKELLAKIRLGSTKDKFNWGSVNDISDYLTTFTSQIKDKLKDNVNILYNEELINLKMMDKKKPFKGQIPIIQGGLETLRKKGNRFLYLAGEPGVGKTLLSIKTNHLHHLEKGQDSYCTLVVAPTSTLTQWSEEIKDCVIEDVDVIVIRDTNQFIRLYEETGFKMNKPTYLLVGKETFKLSYKTVHGVNIVKRNVKVEKQGSLWDEVIDEVVEVCTCPDCGLPLKNPLRKSIVYLTEKDFNRPKKSNYKCSECGTVLWQATYVKNRKTSVIDYVKRKNIKFDSLILDEAHESNNAGSIIGNATRVILQRAKKSILLSGTVTNGYASSIYNILFALIPNTLKRDNVFTQEEFVKAYGTLMAVTDNKDNIYHITSRTQIRDSQFQEVEGINPLVFAKYFSNNFIFAELSDIRDNLPKLNEYYIGVEQLESVKQAEKELREEIKTISPFSASFYNESVIKHYANKPFDWCDIEFNYVKDGLEIKEEVTPPSLPLENTISPKDKELIDICKKHVDKGEKVWVYNDFITNGKYTTGTPIESRLKVILEKAGLRVYVLTSAIRTIDRKNVIDKNKDNYDVFISNAKLVGTGINMQWCTNYIFYSPTYHVNTVRQASRRGLRVNSNEDNSVYHLYYDTGIESEIMERYKLKKVEADAVQAKFTEVGEVNRTASSLGARIERELSE